MTRHGLHRGYKHTWSCDLALAGLGFGRLRGWWYKGGSGDVWARGGLERVWDAKDDCWGLARLSRGSFGRFGGFGRLRSRDLTTGRSFHGVVMLR
jgi:hypothetical protein